MYKLNLINCYTGYPIASTKIRDWEFNWCNLQIVKDNIVTNVDTFTQCKDYLVDNIVNGGCHYPNNYTKFNTESNLICLQIKDRLTDVKDAINELNLWEKEHNLEPTTLHKTQYKYCHVVSGDLSWKSNTLAFSTWLTILRDNNTVQLNNKESKYKNILEKLPQILAYKTSNMHGWIEYNTYYNHGSLGFYETAHILNKNPTTCKNTIIQDIFVCDA